jgi:Cytochrome c554 and c-prime
MCGTCHHEKLELFSNTAHRLTSRLASAKSIAGSFKPGENVLKTSNPGLSFRMEPKGERFFEVAIWGIPPSTTEQSEPIDVVIGSARKGQTYLYWKNDRLFQLPVSYWVELGRWVNSPGYADGYADFDRPVMPRCLECHGSYAESVAGQPPNNHYKRNSLVLGISCERCHGPGREHVARHQSAGASASSEAIVNPAKLPRRRDVEVCAQCHAGMRYPITPAFSYVPGEPLDNYLDPDRSDPNKRIDVHGGQVALLQRSRCYQSSDSMTCSTCHDVHQTQRNMAEFSARCLSCHQIKDCGVQEKSGAKMASGCVNCHMPVQESNAIVSDSNGKRIEARVRTHWIKVYPEAVSSGSREFRVEKHTGTGDQEHSRPPASVH